MNAIEDTLAANREFARRFSAGELARTPARSLAVLTCIDARINVEQALGLANGDAHILRNAGAIATDDVVRTLVISHQEFGTREIMVIGHTECGLLRFDGRAFSARLERQFGAPEHPLTFHGFDDLEASIRRQVQTIKSHPWLRKALVRGFVYDVKTGMLNEVKGG